MLDIVLIDDEINALKGLELELRNFNDQVKIQKRFTNALQGLEYLIDHDIDLLFLDIEMPGMNGLEFLEQMPNRNFQVVFTTAYSEYAIEALKLEAFDYLLKPIDIVELGVCLERVALKLTENKVASKLEIALNKLSMLSSGHKKIKLTHGSNITFLDPDEISYCEANGNYTHIYIDSGDKILLTLQLKQVQNLLPEDLFFRIHNSYIINLGRVKSYSKSDYLIILDNGIQLPVSRANRTDMLDRI